MLCSVPMGREGGYHVEWAGVSGVSGGNSMAMKTALVLSGGGAKGAFQVGALRYLHEQGYTWDVIAGVSVGALNGTMLAMDAFDELEALWRTVTPAQVLTGRMNIWALVRMLFGARSIYGNEPLWEMIIEKVRLEKIRADLRIGVVSLRTGRYFAFRPDDFVNAPPPGFDDPELAFKRAILASTAMPVIWPPVDIPPLYSAMVDGGVRNISPLGDVLDAEPDEVVVINCSPAEPGELETPPRNVLQIALRSLEVALDEIFHTDTREFLRINRNVREAAEAGVTLHNESGKPFKYYRHLIIQPDAPLDDTLDFSRPAIMRSLRAGYAKAKEVLGAR